MASRISNNKSLLSRLSFGDLATWGGKEKSVYENDVMRLLRARNKASVSSPTGVGQLIWPSGGPFLESPDNFLGPKSSFTFVVLAFKIKVSITLKMRQCNHQLTKQNWPVCELGTVPLFNRFWFQNLPRTRRVTGLSRNGPRDLPLQEDSWCAVIVYLTWFRVQFQLSVVDPTKK